MILTTVAKGHFAKCGQVLLHGGQSIFLKKKSKWGVVLEFFYLNSYIYEICHSAGEKPMTWLDPLIPALTPQQTNRLKLVLVVWTYFDLSNHTTSAQSLNP
jgi:hypothetical protein